MTHTIQEIIELMPGKDCGSCGNPSCRTMARKIAVGDRSVNDCVNLGKPEFASRKERIFKILREGVEVGAKSTVVLSEEGITYIHPCVSEAGKLAAESRLTSGPEGKVELKYGFLDPIMLCFALENYRDVFDEVQCSPRMGVAKLEYRGKSVLIFQNGSIKIRNAKDREDILQTLRFVARVMWGSIICACCGNAGVDCASGGCEDCATRICPVLGGGPPEPATEGPVELRKTDGAATFVRVSELETGPIFMAGIQKLDQVVGSCKNNMASLKRNEPVKEIENIHAFLKSVNHDAIDFVVKTPRKEDATLGLILAGLSVDFKRIAGAQAALSDKLKDLKLSKEVKELMDEAERIFSTAYAAFKKSDYSLAKQAVATYKSFTTSAKPLRKGAFGDAIVEIEKIANNGFYIARLVPKPLPA